MIESEGVFTLRVECYAGYREEQYPCRFFLNRRKIEVVDILDQWLAPDHRYFKVKGDDGATYIIRHEVTSGLWELTMFNLTD